MKSGTYDTAALSIVKSFETKSGNSLNIQAFPYAALQQNNTNAILGGTCNYNVVSGSYYLAPLYNKFASLDALAKSSKYADALLPGLWDRSEVYKGHHIGLPYGPDSYGMMIRTDLFTQAGLTVPKTWPDLLKALGVLKTKFASQGIAPFIFSGGAPEQMPALLFAGYDGYFIDSKGHYQLDTAKATSAIQLGQNLMAAAPKQAMGMTIDAAGSAFTNGKAAVLYGFPSFVRQQADKSSAVAGKWAVVPNPQPGFTWLSLWQMYMTQCTTNTTAAWQWMTDYSSAANDKKFFVDYGIDPSFAATYKDPELLKTHANFFPGEAANLAVAKNPPLTSEAQDFMASTLGTVFAGATSPEKAVALINTKWQSLPVPAALLEAANRDGLVQK